MQSFGKVRSQTERLVTLMKDGFKEKLKISLLFEAMGGASGAIITIATVAIIILGGNLIFSGALTLGELLVFTTYLASFFFPLEQLMSSVANIKQSYAVIERVYEVLDDHREVDSDETSGGVLNGFNQGIEFVNTTILHDDTPILLNVNLNLEKGKKIGLIGRSGSGKSTLVDALTRNNPHQGYIKVDGHDINDININSLRSLFSSVQQNPSLFSDTIFNNIAYGVDTAPTKEQVIAAAQAADAHEFIMQLPQQYDTNAGEAGAFLSGGQMQRIAIARAFLRNAPILLLDEPTSSLDVESEKHIMDAIFNLMKDRTVVMVSHKMSLLAYMDHVLVVAGGGVRDVNDYGGLERYLQYLHAHELV